MLGVGSGIVIFSLKYQSNISSAPRTIDCAQPQIETPRLYDPGYHRHESARQDDTFNSVDILYCLLGFNDYRNSQTSTTHVLYTQ